MEIKISKEELSKKKLFLATPMYGGMNHGLYAKSCLDLQALLGQMGVEVRYSFLFNESLITRARNYLVDEFLRAEQYTHLLFIDSDIHFNPQDVLAMLALDKEVIGGPYPKKSINWRNIAEAVKKNPNTDPGELSGLVGEFVFNPVAGTQQFSVQEPLEVLELGTGFMMIRREVFKKFETAYPQYRYKPDHAGQKHFDGSRMIHAYFDTIIDRGPDAPGTSERYLSEDYFFCQMVRKIGVKIWLCPWVRTGHIGTYEFSGDLPRIAAMTGKL
mgnify:CR=1 FL=1